MSAPLRLLPGDVPPSRLAAAARTSLEVSAGEVRLLRDGEVQRRWPVSDCRLSQPYGDGPTAYVVDFVAPDGSARCSLDLASWTPAVSDAPPSEWHSLGAPLASVRGAVALAAGVRGKVQPADASKAPGNVVLSTEARFPRGQIALGLALAAAVAVGDILGFVDEQPVPYAVGGGAAVLLAVLFATPRSWWPRPHVPMRTRVDLGHGSYVGVPEAADALVLSQPQAMCTILPLGDAPTAVARARVDGTLGRLELVTAIGTRVVVPVSSEAVAALESLLQGCSVPVSHAAVASSPRGPAPATGDFRDAVPGTGYALAALFAVAAALAASGGGDFLVAVLTHVLAAATALAAGVTGTWQQRSPARTEQLA